MTCNDTAYTEFVLNSNLWDTIDMQGDTTYGLRYATDVSNNAPTTTNWLSINMSESTGTSKDPYIDITVEVESTPTPTPTPDPINLASTSYYQADIADKTLYHGTILFFLGFIFPIWYFNKKRNDRVFSIYGEVKHKET